MASTDTPGEERDTCFREIVEHAPFGLWLSATDGTLLEINPAACRMLELIDIPWMTLMHPEDLPGALERRERLLHSDVTHTRQKDVIFIAAGERSCSTWRSRSSGTPVASRLTSSSRPKILQSAGACWRFARK